MDIYDIISNKNIDCCFAVFIIDDVLTRYRIPKFKTSEDFLEWICNYKTRVTVSGIDSDNFDVFSAIYFDIYFKNTLNSEKKYK